MEVSIMFQEIKPHNFNAYDRILVERDRFYFETLDLNEVLKLGSRENSENLKFGRVFQDLP
jgi:hypothetical protein